MGHKKGITFLSHLSHTLLCGTLSMSQEHRQAMLILATAIHLHYIAGQNAVSMPQVKVHVHVCVCAF